MILALYKRNWYIAERAGPHPGCGLRAGLKMPNCGGFELNPHKTYLRRSFPTCEGIVFYPEVRFEGLRVYPWNGWHPESAEPLLQVIVNSYSAYSREPREIVEARRARMQAKGWRGGHYDGYTGYVHVDDLEKIEGPPPEGPF